VKDNYDYVGRVLDQRITRDMKRSSVPGVAVAVIADQRVVWSKGYGVTYSRGAPVTVDTCFRVGSISKLFTATEIVRMANRGDVALDAPFSTQLPGFSVRNDFGSTPPITSRALLAHHSGMPDNYLRGMWEAQPGSLEELQSALRDAALIAPPQSRYSYSNLDYAVLGRLIEYKTGQPFAVAMQRDVLQPLGMVRATFERNARIPPECAKGHRKGRELEPTGLRDEPAGALVASASDLAKFLEWVLADGSTNGEHFMSAEAIRTMFEPQFANLPMDFGQRVGLGWLLSGADVAGASGPIAWHAGEYPGYRAAVVISRKDKLAAVVLANSEDVRVVEIATEALGLALEVKMGQAVTPTKAGAGTTVKVSPHELAPLAGDYAVFGTKTRIEAENGKLGIHLFDHQLDLVPTVDGAFAVRKDVLGLLNIPLSNLSVRFTTVEGRRYALLEGLRAPMAFQRLEREPIPQAWLDRLGDYTAEAGDDTLEFLKFELAVEDGVLIARVTTNSRVTGVAQATGSVVLLPVSPDAAEVPQGGGMDGGLLQASRRGDRQVLTYSGYVLIRRTN
jgi:CubicO group peptidase (beta-lactamase class C family)